MAEEAACEFETTSELDACSVEWCPAVSHQDVVACGTYQLIKHPATGPDRRVGRVQVYHFSRDDESVQLEKAGHVDSEGVLDMKWWTDVDSPPELATADAAGNLTVYALDAGRHLRRLTSTRPDHATCLALSLDWSNHKSSAPCRVAVSYSDGSLAAVQVGPASAAVTSRWDAHGFEAWIACWDRWDANRLYSGGDDCLLKGWDVRAPDACFVNRSHLAGVCSAHCHPTREHVVATGSYDERVRVWDARFFAKRTLAEADAGGGVWRLKWQPRSGEQLLAACMYGGVRVLRGADLTPLATFHRHESMAYGADWRRCDDDGERSMIIASCSFYDRRLCLWSC